LPASLLRALSRSGRRLWLGLVSRGLAIVYDPRYEQGVRGVPLDPERGGKILGALEEAGVLGRRALSRPLPVSIRNLLRVHSAAYLQQLQEPEALTRILGVEIPPHLTEQALELQRLMVGGTIQATRLALRTGGAAAHLGGGFHHATADRGLGFCVFNDIAVAVRRLRARGYGQPVLVVDLDLHDGNGTRAIFADDPSVHTFSVHNEHWGPTAAVASTALALGPDVGDAKYLAALHESLPPVFATFRPGLVIYVAGTDGAADDSLGNWQLSTGALVERDRLVTALVRGAERPIPLVVLLGGGYGPRAWRHSARFLLRLASGRALEPLEEELVLARKRGLLEALRAAEARDDGLAFSLSVEDLAGLVPGVAAAPRFLGLLSRHGVELLLERSGFLAELRTLGFSALRIGLEAREGTAPTLRVLAEVAGAPQPLVELRATRSRSAVAGMEVIDVEWLLLQNPRASFSERRPRLPGQEHPGLGLLREIMGCLVVLCEAHALDGIHFVAAQYHIVAQSRRLTRPIDPAVAAHVRAAFAALQGLGLAEATAAVEAGRLVDAASGAPVRWAPVALVLPVSSRLRARVEGPEYERGATRASAGLHYELRAAPL
jgi:acetoin utilization deacetylase AcuC-like enzyme